MFPIDDNTKFPCLQNEKCASVVSLLHYKLPFLDFTAEELVKNILHNFKVLSQLAENEMLRQTTPDKIKVEPRFHCIHFCEVLEELVVLENVSSDDTLFGLSAPCVGLGFS